MKKDRVFENEISIDKREYLESFLNAFEYKTSGLSFTSLYMWREINKFSYRQIGDYLCIGAVNNLEVEMNMPFMFPPLTNTTCYESASLRKTVLEAKDIFESEGHAFEMMLVPFHMLEIFREAFPDELIIEADRPNYDYVYNTEDLINLSGRAFHSKKNHLNYFKKNYDYEYIEMTSEMADDAMRFIREFNERKQVEDPHEKALLLMEEEAMADVFKNIERVGYLTGAIKIDGKIEAISIGGYLGRKTVTVHVEKANTEYRGLYQAINNEFCKHMARNVKRINREEDMGIEGLRKAKLSYNPCKLVEKYTIKFKENH